MINPGFPVEGETQDKAQAFHRPANATGLCP
jgi:hypothetical protein